MKTYPEFPCTKCGACCRVLSPICGPSFGLTLGPDGVCEHLLQDNTCSIYEKRPAVCNIRETWVRMTDINPDWIEFMRRTARACNRLQRQIGVDESYRLRVPSDPNLPPVKSQPDPIVGVGVGGTASGGDVDDGV